MAPIEEFQRLLGKIQSLSNINIFSDDLTYSRNELELLINDLRISIISVPSLITFEVNIIDANIYWLDKFYDHHSYDVLYPYLRNIGLYLNNIIEKLSIQNDNRTPIILEKNSDSMNDKKDVFIVHGHDNEMKETVARFLDKMGLNPTILHEQPNEGLTIIEKFEYYANLASYAIILYSPDDKTDGGKNRARQNVVFEHGFFIGKLGRNKIVAINRIDCDMELQSDINGVLYIPFDSDSGWKVKLLKDMEKAGLDIDWNVFGKL